VSRGHVLRNSVVNSQMHIQYTRHIVMLYYFTSTVMLACGLDSVVTTELRMTHFTFWDITHVVFIILRCVRFNMSL
jgi:hypothetical protein